MTLLLGSFLCFSSVALLWVSSRSAIKQRRLFAQLDNRCGTGARTGSSWFRKRFPGVSGAGSGLQRTGGPEQPADIRQLVLLTRRMAMLLHGGRNATGLWRDALRAAEGPAMAELVSRAAAAVEVGLSPAQALREYARSAHYPEPLRASLVQLAAVLQISESTGAPLASLLERFADHLESELDTEALRRNALAGPQATARLLLWLPAVGLLLTAALGIDLWVTLTQNAWGLTAFGAGLVLMFLSRIWVRHLVARASQL